MTTTETRERVWSVSAAHLYRDVCPRQWSYRHGPHQVPRRRGPAPLHLTRGRILHAGISAAYMAAARELLVTPGGLAGARMDRYWAAARRALGAAWEAEGAPDDPDEALEVLRLLGTLLAALPVPERGGIYAIEREIRGRLDSGLPVTARPDLILSPAPGHVVVVDWKTGKLDAAEVLRSQQLLIYAWLIAAADDTITDVAIELHSIRGAEGHRRTPPPELVAEAVDRLDRTARRAEADTDCEPNPGGHCESCPFTRICPAVSVVDHREVGR